MLRTVSGPRTARSASPTTTSQRAVAAACIGNAVEWYDFAIYGALATVLAVVFFPAAGLATALSAAFAAYGTALLVRPLGALIFGRLGDTHGRRTVLVRVILLMAGATAAVALLPGYATLGLVAPILLMLLRATQGLAAGGELGVAAAFILEYAPVGRRGQSAAWHTATMAAGIGSGMVVAGILANVFGDDPGSGWWRIPFLLALPLGLIGLHLRRSITDTPHFAALQNEARLVNRPVRELWRAHGSSVRRGFCLVAAGSLGFNIFFIFMPNNLILRHGAALGSTLLATAASLGVTAVAALALGRASDRVGRRPVVIVSTAGLMLLAVPMSILASNGPLVSLLVAQTVVGVMVSGVLSVAMLGELFAASVRSTGLALTAGLATALIGGTAPWLAQILVRVSGTEAAPGAYLALISVLALVALWRWPETAFEDLR